MPAPTRTEKPRMSSHFSSLRTLSLGQGQFGVVTATVDGEVEVGVEVEVVPGASYVERVDPSVASRFEPVVPVWAEAIPAQASAATLTTPDHFFMCGTPF